MLKENNHVEFDTPYRRKDDGDFEYPLGLGVKNGFREIVMRSPGRYEISLQNGEEALEIGAELSELKALLLSSSHLSFIPSLLDSSSWEGVHICNISFVVSTPGSKDQGWHADGGHVNVHEHMPCHCLNVFIPLTDVPEELGPTEFRPGTQVHTRNLVPMMLAARARKTLRPPVLPELNQGDVLLFDYRVLHRGRSNQTKHTNRPILVFTVCKPWFKDILNFPSKTLTIVNKNR